MYLNIEVELNQARRIDQTFREGKFIQYELAEASKSRSRLFSQRLTKISKASHTRPVGDVSKMLPVTPVVPLHMIKSNASMWSLPFGTEIVLRVFAEFAVCASLHDIFHSACAVI
jgi:hypothetical protein